MLDFAVHAENVGFDSVFVLATYRRTRQFLAGVARRSGRAHVQSHARHECRNAHFSLSPVDRCPGFRHSWCHVPGPHPAWRRHRRVAQFKERFARLKEAVDLIRTLWTQDRVTYEGTYYQTSSATIYDRPESLIPIYLAGAGPQSARLAGRIGDGFICTSGKAPELYTEKLLPSVAEGIEKSGQSKPAYENLIEMKVSFDSDRERALQDTRHWAALALSPEEKLSTEDPVEMEKLADELPIERAASRWIVSDDPEEHIGHIEPYINMGFSHLVFHAPGTDQIRFLDLYSEQVLPLLRSRYG